MPQAGCSKARHLPTSWLRVRLAEADDFGLGTHRGGCGQLPNVCSVEQFGERLETLLYLL
jgi:hypothetical protein